MIKQYKIVKCLEYKNGEINLTEDLSTEKESFKVLKWLGYNKNEIKKFCSDVIFKVKEYNQNYYSFDINDDITSSGSGQIMLYINNKFVEKKSYVVKFMNGGFGIYTDELLNNLLEIGYIEEV